MAWNDGQWGAGYWGDWTDTRVLGRSSRLTVYVRDANLNTVGELERIEALEWTERLHGVGGWVLDTDVVGAELLLATPGAGIVIWDETPPGGGGPRLVYSGPMSEGPAGAPAAERRLSQDGTQLDDRVRITGTDDMTWLAERVVYPDPAHDEDAWASAYDVRTGTASTVILDYIDANAGPGALTARRVTGLALPTDPTLGATVTGRGRLQNLLSFLAELAAAGGVVFTVRQDTDDDALAVTIGTSTDRSADVAFSMDLGNLEAHNYSVERADGTYVIVGGQGEGAARAFTSAASAGGRRVETFVDRRDISDPGELDQAAVAALADRAGRTSLQMVPIDTRSLAYGTHYRLGDTVRVDVDGVAVTDVLTAVRSSLTPSDFRRTITVGQESQTGPIALYTGLRTLAQRLRQLERI